jgi:SulP family sulfate permease
VPVPRLTPQLWTSLRTYGWPTFVSDLGAGVIVGIVALPLAIAFGIASGVTPQQGLFTAIIAGLVISALGGSPVQIGGPTGAFVVIVYGIVQQYGYDGLAVATLMAGLMLIGLGVARLGTAIKFIPYPVTTGFTTGIAVLIASQQIKDVLGLTMEAVPADFFPKWEAYAAAIGSINVEAAGLTIAALAILVLWPRVSRRIPSPLVALLACSAAVPLFGLDVETIGSRFGTLAMALPVPRIPEITLVEAQALVQPAIAIALLGGIESLLSAVVADGMTGTRHRSNMELVAQGVANVASPLFGGIPATGAIARTATNVRNGARTPVAGIIHAVTLLAITLFLGRWAALIPMAVLGAILLIVAVHMSEVHRFRALLRAPRSDVVVLLLTFTLTVVVDLVVAIEVGMVLAAFLFMRRMAEVTNVGMLTRELQDEEGAGGVPASARRIPPGVVVYEINGPFFFGAAETFKDTIAQTQGKPRVLVLRLGNVPAIDATGLYALMDVVRRSRGDGTRIILSELRTQPLIALERSGALDEIGEEHVFESLDEALAAAGSPTGAHPRPAVPAGSE